MSTMHQLAWKPAVCNSNTTEKGLYLMMEIIWLLSWALTTFSEEIIQSSSLSKPRSRLLALEDRQDVTSYQSSYYPYRPSPYVPPSYGPPPSEPPTGSIHLEFAFDEIVLKCVTEEPLEHVIWTRYKCPQQFQYGGDGTHVADGSKVYQDKLYDVHIRGHDGTIISELLLKDPLNDESEGIYQCEAWPHIHRGHGGVNYPYSYQPYNAPRSNVFIIGGNTLLEDCYHVSSFGTQITKVPNINNKVDVKNENDATTKQISFALKQRLNNTQSRKNGNSKRLKYSLKFKDRTLYNFEGRNVTDDNFYPILNIPLEKTNSSFVQNCSESNLCYNTQCISEDKSVITKGSC